MKTVVSKVAAITCLGAAVCQSASRNPPRRDNIIFDSLEVNTDHLMDTVYGERRMAWDIVRNKMFGREAKTKEPKKKIGFNSEASGVSTFQSLLSAFQTAFDSAIEKGDEQVGVFRVGPSDNELTEAIKQINKGDFDFDEDRDVSLWSSLIKKWLDRQGLGAAFETFLGSCKEMDGDYSEAWAHVTNALHSTKHDNAIGVLYTIFELMQFVEPYQGTTKMGVTALSAIFASKLQPEHVNTQIAQDYVSICKPCFEEIYHSWVTAMDAKADLTHDLQLFGEYADEVSALISHLQYQFDSPDILEVMALPHPVTKISKVMKATSLDALFRSVYESFDYSSSKAVIKRFATHFAPRNLPAESQTTFADVMAGFYQTRFSKIKSKAESLKKLLDQFQEGDQELAKELFYHLLLQFNTYDDKSLLKKKFVREYTHLPQLFDLVETNVGEGARSVVLQLSRLFKPDMDITGAIVEWFEEKTYGERKEE